MIKTAINLICDGCTEEIESIHPRVHYIGNIFCMVCWGNKQEELLIQIFDPFNTNDHLEITKEEYFNNKDYPPDIVSWPGWKPKESKNKEARDE